VTWADLHPKQLRRAVSCYVEHHPGERNHQGLDNELIDANRVAANDNGQVVCDERLGGLLKYCRRAA
jgi:putative transposase